MRRATDICVGWLESDRWSPADVRDLRRRFVLYAIPRREGLLLHARDGRSVRASEADVFRRYPDAMVLTGIDR